MGFTLYRKKNIRILLFLAAFALFSCQKDDLTQPAEVYFHFKLDRLPSTNQSLSFQAGAMEIQSISFIGDRETGDDVGFVSDFGAIVHADLATGNSDPIIKFDIPQGTYTHISLVVDPDDTQPDLVITGEYMPGLLGHAIPVQLEIDLPGKLNLRAVSATGTPDITVRKDSRSTVEIFLNPSQWITDIPLVSFETAELQNVGGVPSILISKDFNQEIYSKLSGLVELSAEAVFM